LQEFICAGGLKILTQLLLDNNLYSRGQAVEIFLSVTDCDTFDWFQPISDEFSDHQLYQEMFSLLETPLLYNLIENRKSSFPGGSVRCLQLLAFWLSWLRFHFTDANHKLQLHARLLEIFRSWATDGDLESHEVELAKTLLDDFSAAGAYGSEYDNDKSCSFLSGIIAPRFPASESPPESEALDQTDPQTRPTVCVAKEADPTRLKEKGNKFFLEEKPQRALECYTSAIDALRSRGPHEESSPLLATLHYNCASSYWKLSESVDPSDTLFSTGSASPVQALLDSCIESCTCCLDLDPFYFKARYRCAVALHQLGRLDEAIDFLDSRYVSPDLIPDPKTLEMFQDLRRFCVARILLQQKESPNNTSAKVIDERTTRILAQISSRRNATDPLETHDHPPLVDLADPLPGVPTKKQGKKSSSQQQVSPPSSQKHSLKFLKKLRICASQLDENYLIDSTEVSLCLASLGKVCDISLS
jgi:tetratricopeptide (TPR) repeat protein